MNFPGEQFDKVAMIPGNYFNQGSYYISGSGQIRRVEDMNHRYAQNAIKRYREAFPQHVRHINRTRLGRALRYRYLHRYIERRVARY